MPATLESHRAVVVQVGTSEFLYVIGGKESGASTSNKVYFARLNPDGSPSDWTPTLSINYLTGLQEHSAVAVGDRIYVLGGRADDTWNDTFDSVYCAKPEATGDVTDWIPIDSMPTDLALHDAVVLGNTVFVLGGCSAQKERCVSEVWAADITGDGCPDLQWRHQSEEPLLHDLAAFSAVAIRFNNGRKFIYVIGGYDGTTHKLVWRAEVGSNDRLAPWVPLGDINQASTGFFRHTSGVSGRYLYVIGGTTDGFDRLDVVYRARIKSDGTLGTWSTLDRFPIPVFNHAATVSAPGSIYVLGGNTASDSVDQGYFTPLLHFGKLATPRDLVTYGDTINYTLRLDNLGVRDLEDLIITDTVETNVQATFEFHDLPGECRVHPNADNTITCTIPTLELGEARDLNFAVSVSQPTTASYSTSALLQSTSATFAFLANSAWTQPCAAAHLEVQGVGISNLEANTLYIPNPETIESSSMRVQAAFKGEKPDQVVFYSDGTSYTPTQVSTTDSTAVYEKDIPVSDAVNVTVQPVDGWTGGLTAYFLRAAEKGYSLVGHTMNQPVYHSAYTQVLKLPIPTNNGDLTVKAVVIDNNDPYRVIRISAEAGGRSQEVITTTSNCGNHLNIIELQLSDIPVATNEITIVAESPLSEGESFVLVGLAAETAAGCLPYVLNRAQACIGSNCWSASTMNAYFHVYLPLVLRNAP